MQEYKTIKITGTIIFNQQKVQINTKISIHNTLALPTLPYGSKA
jgi:hypothetical protein